MHNLVTFLPPQRRLRPQPFITSIAVVYVVGAASHWLTLPDVTARVGLLPFAAAQALLTWIWFILHAKRLHDAARGYGLAGAGAPLFLLSLLVLLVFGADFFGGSEKKLCNASATNAVELIPLLHQIMTPAG